MPYLYQMQYSFIWIYHEFAVLHFAISQLTVEEFGIESFIIFYGVLQYPFVSIRSIGY